MRLFGWWNPLQPKIERSAKLVIRRVTNWIYRWLDQHIFSLSILCVMLSNKNNHMQIGSLIYIKYWEYFLLDLYFMFMIAILILFEIKTVLKLRKCWFPMRIWMRMQSWVLYIYKEMSIKVKYILGFLNIILINDIKFDGFKLWAIHFEILNSKINIFTTFQELKITT